MPFTSLTSFKRISGLTFLNEYWIPGLPKSPLVAWPGYQTFPCYVLAQSEFLRYTKMTSHLPCIFPSVSSSPVQYALQKEITITIQALWTKKWETPIREGKNTDLDGFCQRRDLQQRQSYSRVLSHCPLADTRTLPTYQNVLYSATKVGENSANWGTSALACVLQDVGKPCANQGRWRRWENPAGCLPVLITVPSSPQTLSHSCFLTAFIHILLLQSLTHLCYLPPGPPSASASLAKADLLDLKQVLKAPWEFIGNH